MCDYPHGPNRIRFVNFFSSIVHTLGDPPKKRLHKVLLRFTISPPTYRQSVEPVKPAVAAISAAAAVRPVNSMAPAPICQDCGAKSIVKGQILPPLARATTCQLPAPCPRAAPPRRASNFVSPRFALPFCKRAPPRSVMSFYRKSQPNLSHVAETSFRSNRP